MPATLDDIALKLTEVATTLVGVCAASDEIKKQLIAINGRVRAEEQKAATLWERVDSHHRILTVITGVVATVAGTLIVAGAIKLASLF